MLFQSTGDLPDAVAVGIQGEDFDAAIVVGVIQQRLDERVGIGGVGVDEDQFEALRLFLDDVVGRCGFEVLVEEEFGGRLLECVKIGRDKARGIRRKQYTWLQFFNEWSRLFIPLPVPRPAFEPLQFAASKTRSV